MSVHLREQPQLPAASGWLLLVKTKWDVAARTLAGWVQCLWSLGWHIGTVTMQPCQLRLIMVNTVGGIFCG